MNKFHDGVGKVLSAVLKFAGVLLGLACLIGASEVFFRYVLNSAHDWGGEVTRDLAQASIFLAGAPVLWIGRHINISMLLDKLSGLSLRTLTIVNSAFTLTVMSVLTFAGVYRFLQLYRLEMKATHSLGYSLWIPFLPVAIGFFLMTFVAAVMLAETLKAREVPSRAVKESH